MISTRINKTEKIADDLYVITETESVHCYLLIGEEKALLIDCGYGYEDIHPIIQSITTLPVILAVTHGDPDHALGAGHFGDLWIHPLDYGKLLMNDNPSVKSKMLTYRLNKMPQLNGEIEEDTYVNTPISQKLNPHFLLNHDVIDLGGKHVEIFHTPGHSYGHIMFLEQETGRLFSGDQLTANNIWHFLSSDEQAPFSATFNSLKRLGENRDRITALYPAHNKFPIGIEYLDDLVECFDHELKENYKEDVPFQSPMGEGYKHRYKTVDLIYSDERLADFLGHRIQR